MEKRIKELINENDDLKIENESLKEIIKCKENETESKSSAWDFRWDGRGSYEQSRAAFYGEFS